MKRTFRQSMAWLHTWTGLVVGWVLYFVFFTGTIGYFYVEVDRWMRPEQPLTPPGAPVRDVVRAADAYLRREAAGAASWSIDLDAGRSGMLTLGWTAADGSTQQRYFDQRSGTFEPLRVRETGGGYALYRMHWGLRYLPGNSGYYFVGMCTMVMLIALVTGVITHKKIFSDFLVFRPGQGQRSWLDGHVMMGTLALPFLLAMTLTGLAYYRTALMPAAMRVLYGGDEMAMVRETYTFPPQRASAVAAPTIALERIVDGLIASSNVEWSSMSVNWPGDAVGEVRVYHSGRGGLLRAGEVQMHFSAVDGRLLRRVSPGDAPGRGTQSALEGLHEAVFAGVALRWVLFLCGVAGTVMVATGLVLWTVKRRAKAVRNGSWGLGHHLVERLNIGTIAGLPVATGVYFCANRLLPIEMPRRAEWEMHALFITWAVMFTHATIRRPARAWVESLSAGALIFALLPVLNVMTTDRHLGISLPAGVWALASVDLTFVAFAAVLAIIAVFTWKHA